MLFDWIDLAIFLLWVLLNIFAIVLSFKDKNKNWGVVLIINVVVGFFLPTYVSMILPITYLVIRKRKKTSIS